MDLKKTPYWNIYADIFNYFKQSMPVQNTDEYWDKVEEGGEALSAKYTGTEQSEFVVCEIINIQKELTRIWQEQKKTASA